MIRLANTNDLNASLSLIKACIIDMKEKGVEQWPDFYPNIEILQNDISKGNLFVAELKNEIIGIVALSPSFPKQYEAIPWKYKSKMANSIHRFAVSPKKKDPNLAKKLIYFVEDLSRKQGYDVIRLDTYSKNTIANKFYSKMGYKYAGDINQDHMPELYNCFEKRISLSSG